MLKKSFFKSCTIVILCALSVSCSDETAVNKMLGISASAPMFTNYKVVSGTQVDFAFSTSVKVVSVSFTPETPVASTQDGKSVSVNFVSDQSGGKKLTADILVEDDSGNTLNVLVPFRTRNDRVPVFVINEVRTGLSKPRCEFIELKTKTAGNLGALRLFIASTSNDEPIYEFPPVEVRANEYVVLHLRTYPEQLGCVDELGENLNTAYMSGTAIVQRETQNTARDLFVPQNKKFLHDADVVYILDQDDKIVEALAFSNEEKSWTKNANLSKAAEFLAKGGAWLSASGVPVKKPEFADAVFSAGATYSKTICRKEAASDTNTSKDWYVSTQGNSPGMENIAPSL
ncbi:MAG: hypothetical protein Ta2G_05660 [Termitinemataceae bacterium]|nr:MAG: hypothetical protein Ta2G_05660 [Termitinemataceae bacterium]